MKFLAFYDIFARSVGAQLLILYALRRPQDRQFCLEKAIKIQFFSHFLHLQLCRHFVKGECTAFNWNEGLELHVQLYCTTTF